MKRRRAAGMKYVYLIRSINQPDQKYVGVTSNLKERLQVHNNKQSPHTSKYAPWELVVFTGFVDEARAFEFEKYLKSHSGRAFTKKHFISGSL